MTPTRAQTRAALVASVEKWRKNSEVEEIEDALVGRTKCPLCTLFNSDPAQDSCIGCPVYSKPERRYCGGTPFMQADYAHQMANLPAFHTAALAEVAFLEQLLVEFDAETEKMEKA